MAGEFDEFLPQNPSKEISSVQGAFDEFMPNSKIQPTEGLLGSIASIAKLASQSMTGLGEQNENPLMTGISSTMRGLKQVPGLGPYMIGHDIKSKLVGDLAGKDNPVGGIALDVISDPETYLGLGLAKKGIQKIPEMARKATGWVAEPWQNTSKISKFKTSGMQDIENIASSELGQANKLGSMRKQVVGKLYGEEPSSALVSEKSYLQKGIEKSSDKEALRLQKDLPKLYGRKSDEFGEGLNKLVGDKPIPVEVSRIQPQLEKSLLDHGILKFDETGAIIPARAPIGQKETKIFNMYRNFKQGLMDNPDISVDASDLIKSQSSMKVPWGKKFSGEDMLMSRVRSNVSSVLEDKIPGLKEFRSSHAPFLKGKYQSIKELNPFSNEYSTKKAAGFLERYAKNEPGKFDPDEKRLVAFLERELGGEINPRGKAFGNQLQESASRSQGIKSKLSDELSKIDRTIEDAKSAISSTKSSSTKQIEDIVDEMIRKNNLEKWKRKGIGIVLSGTILKKVMNWFEKKPND